MPALRRPHRHLVEQRAQHRRDLVRVDRRRARAAPPPPAPRGTPPPRAPPARPQRIAAQRLRRLAQAGDQRGERLRPVAIGPLQRRAGTRSASAQNVAARPFSAAADPRQPRPPAAARAAADRSRARRPATPAARSPLRTSGCLSSASSGKRRPALRRCLRQQQQQRARRQDRQRPPGRIVDLDPPAPAMRRHPPGQRAIGRDQRRRPPRRLPAPRAAPARSPAPPPPASPVRPPSRPPSRRSAGGSPVHLPVNAAGASALAIARARAASASRSPPSRHARTSPRATPHALEQQLEVELRMRLDRPLRSPGPRRPVRPERVPFLVRHAKIEPGEHHQPAGQPRHPPQQPRHRRRGVADARRADQPRAAAPPASARGADRASAARRSAASMHPIAASSRGPAIEHDRKRLQRALPMLGSALLQLERAQPRRRRPPRPAAGPASAPVRPPAAPPPPASIGCPAARRSSCTSRASVSRRRYGSTAGGIGPDVGIGRVERRAQRLARLRIAQRHEPGQQQPALARPHERVGHRPHRAVVGQQHRRARQRQRIVARAPPQPGDQRIGERPVRRDRVDALSRSAIAQHRLRPADRRRLADIEPRP